jgi:hypothetical protein
VSLAEGIRGVCSHCQRPQARRLARGNSCPMAIVIRLISSRPVFEPSFNHADTKGSPRPSGARCNTAAKKGGAYGHGTLRVVNCVPGVIWRAGCSRQFVPWCSTIKQADKRQPKILGCTLRRTCRKFEGEYKRVARQITRSREKGHN